MALFGSIATVRAQAPRTPEFDVAWAYIEELAHGGSPFHRRISALSRGDSQKHELGHGVFAIEQAYDSKPRKDGFFESHRKYIDIQVVVGGEEIMEVIDRDRATVRIPYDDGRDLIVYEDVANSSHLHVRAGEAAIYFPVDVHMPSLHAAGVPVFVRKSVLKVPVSAK